MVVVGRLFVDLDPHLFYPTGVGGTGIEEGWCLAQLGPQRLGLLDLDTGEVL